MEGKYGLSFVTQDSYKNSFDYLEHLLDVSETFSNENENIPSMRLINAAREFNLQTARARRTAPRCINLNQCGSGCPNGSKNSMSKSLIPYGIQNCGRLLELKKALRFNTNEGRAISLICDSHGENIEIFANNFVFSCGTFQTPWLLNQSGILKGISAPVGFHLNTKVLVKFHEDVNAQNATIFSDQIQEFMREGILFMTTNFQPEYIAMFIANKGANLLNEVSNDFSKFALYTIQIHPQNFGKLFFLGKQILPYYYFGHSDFMRI